MHDGVVELRLAFVAQTVPPGASERGLRGGAHRGLVVDRAQQFEVRPLGDGLLDVEDTAGAQHAGGLGERGVEQVAGDVVQAVGEHDDVRGAVAERERLGARRS